jgi:hypothetical protein
MKYFVFLIILLPATTFAGKEMLGTWYIGGGICMTFNKINTKGNLYTGVQSDKWSVVKFGAVFDVKDRSIKGMIVFQIESKGNTLSSNSVMVTGIISKDRSSVYFPYNRIITLNETPYGKYILGGVIGRNRWKKLNIHKARKKCSFLKKNNNIIKDLKTKI